jgi:nucleoside phosphorylase
VSDRADTMARNDFEKFVNEAAANSAKLTLSMLDLLAKSK